MCLTSRFATAAALALLGADCLAQDAPDGGEVDSYPETIAVGAQETEEARASRPRVIEEIVVTAQRRSQNLQEVPIAVTAIDAGRIQEQMIEDVQDYFLKVPNVTVAEGSFGSFERDIAIRGVSNLNVLSASSTFAFYVDDFAAGALSVNSYLYDVERIEVLRGPQGTLFGRNASAGAISITSKQPEVDRFEAAGELNLGSFDQAFGRGVVNLPLSDFGALRMVGGYERRQGPYRNDGPGAQSPGLERWNARLLGRFLLGDALTADFTANLAGEERRDLTGIATGVLGTTAMELLGLEEPVDEGAGFYPDNRRVFYSEVDELSVTDQSQFVLKLRRDFDTFALTGILGRGALDNVAVRDGDGTSEYLLSVIAGDESRSDSQELRLDGRFGNLDLVAGLYHTDETFWLADDNLASNAFVAAVGVGATGLGATSTLYPLFPLLGMLPDDPALQGARRAAFFARNGTEAYAAFADASWQFSEHFSLTAGLRYSDETSNARGRVVDVGGVETEFGPESRSFQDVSPRLVFGWQPAAGRNLYLSAAKGFKAGGFNAGAQDAPPTYKEEILWNYELGAKLILFDGVLRLNSALFYLDWQDQQVGVTIIGDDGSIRSYVDNAAGANNLGIEAEISAILGYGLRLDASLGAMRARFDRYPNAAVSPIQQDRCDERDGVDDDRCDLSGVQLPGAPDLSASADLSYAFTVFGSVGASAILEYAYRDDLHTSIFGIVESDEFPLRVPAFDTWNLRLGLDFGALRLTAFVENLLDEPYYTKPENPISFAGVFVRPTERVYGARLGYAF